MPEKVINRAGFRVDQKNGDAKEYLILPGVFQQRRLPRVRLSNGRECPFQAWLPRQTAAAPHQAHDHARGGKDQVFRRQGVDPRGVSMGLPVHFRLGNVGRVGTAPYFRPAACPRCDERSWGQWGQTPHRTVGFSILSPPSPVVKHLAGDGGDALCLMGGPHCSHCPHRSQSPPAKSTKRS